MGNKKILSEEEKKEKRRKYRLDNKAKRSEYRKEYYQENKVKEKEYYRKNEDKIKETRKKYLQKSEVREKRKKQLFESSLKRKYNLTIEKYNELHEKQKGCCAICHRHQSELGSRLNIDHCHSSNKVRGMLCNQCNQGLGLFKDDPETLKNAIEYLANLQPLWAFDNLSKKDKIIRRAI